MRTKQLFAVGVFSAVLFGIAVLAQTARRDGQTGSDPNVIVMCGDCPGSLFSLTAERGMLLMKVGNEGPGAGDLWFYPFTPGTGPIMVGRLPALGKPIVWNRRNP